MTSRTRRVLLSLVFAPWVSAAPAMQRSELLLVESPPASCNFDLSTIQHELCAIVHDVAKIVEDIAALNTPHIIDLSEYSVSVFVIRSKSMYIANKLCSARVCVVFI
jgi:hypothetical protein